MEPCYVLWRKPQQICPSDIHIRLPEQSPLFLGPAFSADDDSDETKTTQNPVQTRFSNRYNFGTSEDEILWQITATQQGLPIRAHTLEETTRFLEYPELELSNNLAENSMRPVALGRKNWIHIGSPHAGPKIAAILSVVESCRRLKVSVRKYLAAILPGLTDVTIQRLSALTPSAWTTTV
jgi:Transposase IS66 family